MIQARYRSDYDGEFVILESRWKNGAKEQVREWIPNSIENHHISGRAAIIGSNSDLEMFDYRKLQKHKGGLLGKKRLQTYGSGSLWTDMKFDFFVTNNHYELDNIQKNGYPVENIVYTNAKNCIKYPGQFYLVPFNPIENSSAIAVYLAAFDGHNEVFLLGYNKDMPMLNDTRVEEINQIFQSYSTTNFILAGVASNMPDKWRNNHNVKCIKYKEFISYCDV
jgi:hypothetical protein